MMSLLIVQRTHSFLFLAHDIAVDYYQNGVGMPKIYNGSSVFADAVNDADVTMVQRGSTYIMSTKNGWDLLFKGGYVEGGPPVDIVDRVVASLPHFMAVDYQAIRVRKLAELDK